MTDATQIYSKAMQNAKYSEFLKFAKIGTHSIPYFPKIQNLSRQNCISQNTSDSNIRVRVQHAGPYFIELFFHLKINCKHLIGKEDIDQTLDRRVLGVVKKYFRD
jgi:hypothetical protein